MLLGYRDVWKIRRDFGRVDHNLSVFRFLATEMFGSGVWYLWSDFGVPCRELQEELSLPVRRQVGSPGAGAHVGWHE